MNVQEVLMKHVAPGVGDVIALIMFASPLPAILRANREKCLGELNALPFAAMTINCAAWVFYALVLQDYYIYIGNMPGMLLGLFYVLTCYKFSKEAAQDVLRNLMIAGFALYWLLGLVSFAAALNAAALRTLWGATCVSVLGVYYVAPLSSVAKVLMERDSSSLYAPLCAMNIINGLLWFVYGMAIKDWFVALPNGIGAAFNVLYVVLCFVFPARRRQQARQQQLEQQQEQGGETALEQLNPGANWGALRLQSIARRPGQAAPVPGGGFFDLAQLRWRSSKLGSMLRSLSAGSSSSMRWLGSGRRLGSIRQHAAGPPGPPEAAGGSTTPSDASWKVVIGRGDEAAGLAGGAQGVDKIKAAAASDAGEAASDATTTASMAADARVVLHDQQRQPGALGQ